jgi:hypothetical protein
MGRLSGIIGLDLDSDHNGIHEKILSIVPDSPIKKCGGKGFTSFYRFNDESSRGLNFDGVPIGDLLADGRQCVIPPSLHPNGKRYEWQGQSLLEISKDDLPTITEKMWRQINNLICPIIRRPAPQRFTHAPDSTAQDINNALLFIPADCDYTDWCRVGMALHTHSNGAQWGFDLFNDWSMGGTKYKNNEPVAKWASFTPNNGISIGTLFYIAKQYGYTPTNNNRINLLSPEQAAEIKRFLRG